MSVLKIAFVGQCGVYVSSVFFGLFFSFVFPLAAKLIGPQTGCQFLNR